MTQTLRLVKEVLISNAGYEGALNWSSFGSPSTFAQDTAQKHSGANALKIVTATSAPRGGYIDVTVLPSTTYYYGVWSYLTAGTFKLQADGNSSGTLVNNVDLGAADSTWRQTLTSFTTGASDTSVRLYILSTTAVSTGWFDDVRLYQKLIDFQGTSHSLNEMSEYGFDQRFGSVKLNLDVRGTSLTNAVDNLITLGRALLLAKENNQMAESGAAYAPVWLQFQPGTLTNLVQTECLGLTDESQGALEKILANPQTLLSNRLENLVLPLKVRGYWEELTPVAVSGSPFTSDNGTGSMTLASLRGDVSRIPLRIKNRVATTNQTQAIAFLKTKNTPANFVEHFDLNTAAGTGYSVTLNTGLASTTVANQSDADDFINGKGCRVTPSTDLDAASEIDWLVRVLFTSNPEAYTGRARAVLRVRDNHATTPKAYYRVRSVLVNSSGTRLAFSDWWDVARAAQVVSTTGGVPQAWVDCGAGNIPLSHFGGSAPYRPGIEIGGYTTDTSGHATFDLEELFLLMGYEGDDCGLVIANYPQAMGNGAVPDGVIDAFDRAPDAYMVDAADTILVGADSVSGSPLFAYPDRSQVLFYHTRRLSNGTHTHGANNTFVIDYMPRYRLTRGS